MAHNLTTEQKDLVIDGWEIKAGELAGQDTMK